jgi:hypothetical protein
VGRPPVNDEIIEDIYTVGTPLHPIKIGVTISFTLKWTGIFFMKLQTLHEEYVYT